MSYFLGIDQGSHSSRAVLFDGNGGIVEQASQKIMIDRPATGQAEYGAGLLFNSVETVVKQVLDALDRQDNAQVSACGIATQRSTVLAWDVSGRALGPALSWQDVRAERMMAELQQHEREIRRLTGLPLTPYYSSSKMNWLLNQSERVKQCPREALRLSPLISYLLFHLLDNKPYVIDYSNAQRTQLFDLDALTWSERLCNWFDVDISLLPECRPIRAAYGKLYGTDIPVTAVCGDQNAAMYGTGQLEQGMALVNIGSGAFVLRELDHFSESKTQLTGVAYADNETVGYMREATINGAGNALSWAEKQWGVENLIESLPDWMRTVKEPPVFINSVGGLGTPWMQGKLASAFVGNGTYTNAEKAVAIIESIVFMIQVNLELMAVEAPLKKLRVSGGLSKMDGLCQKLSDLSGYVVERSNVAEASARGAAWLAAGRPHSWNSNRPDEPSSRQFVPQQANGLASRYRLFNTELNRMLKANQQVRTVK
ncbi:MAG: FGGY family carbohydrate kinase [Gammaproteobacteria bacterium]|jgi:glycerol kinase